MAGHNCEQGDKFEKIFFDLGQCIAAISILEKQASTLFSKLDSLLDSLSNLRIDYTKTDTKMVVWAGMAGGFIGAITMFAGIFLKDYMSG